jgi:asparagine synthase (glutamine-hydrolysing)
MKQEFFIKSGELIQENEWISKINNFRIDPKDELADSEDIIAARLRKMVDESIKERVEGLDSVGICFSGGLDSSYIAAICKKLKVNFTCYTVGFQDGNFKEPEDITMAKQIAKHLKLTSEEFRYKLFTLSEIAPIIKKTRRILKAIPECNSSDVQTVVSVEVGSVEIAAHSISKNENVFFSGLGSEEIFAGYDRHKKNPVNEECYNGLLNMYNRDLLRDTNIPKAAGFAFSTPFLDDKLIRYALSIPIKYKINDDGSKMILRKAASDYLGKYSERPKKAAQYGSMFDKAIAKLAQINGFKKRVAYLESLK